VQLGSALAYRGIPLQAPYCAAKHAIKGFHDSLRAELLHERSNIKITMVQIPALNTPQFGWVRTRLPRHPQPVPPIFQPEVAAAAIVWASEHAPRTLQAGGPTVLTILGNKLFPGLLDRYLACTAYDGQQTDEPIDASTWQDNLDKPVDDHHDHGAHGAFDARAKGSSAQLWMTTHKPQVAAMICAAGCGLAAGLAGRVRR
jgi:short chain dehydrogenase